MLESFDVSVLSVFVGCVFASHSVGFDRGFFHSGMIGSDVCICHIFVAGFVVVEFSHDDIFTGV